MFIKNQLRIRIEVIPRNEVRKSPFHEPVKTTLEKNLIGTVSQIVTIETFETPQKRTRH